MARADTLISLGLTIVMTILMLMVSKRSEGLPNQLLPMKLEPLPRQRVQLRLAERMELEAFGLQLGADVVARYSEARRSSQARTIR